MCREVLHYMQYLVFSDSHGNPIAMKNVIDRCKEGLGGVIFLGDHIRDAEQLEKLYPELTFYSVAGNCDISSEYQNAKYIEKLIELEGVRVLITHGHTRGVNFHLGELTAFACRANADIVMYGHTHERYIGCRYGEKPQYIFNPGSVSSPRDGLPASFGVLLIQSGQLLLSHGEVYPRKELIP